MITSHQIRGQTILFTSMEDGRIFRSGYNVGNALPSDPIAVMLEKQHKQDAEIYWKMHPVDSRREIVELTCDIEGQTP